MTKSGKKMLKTNVEIFEILFKLHYEKNQDFYNDEIQEIILVAIASNHALIKSVERIENEDKILNLPTSKN